MSQIETSTHSAPAAALPALSNEVLLTTDDTVLPPGSAVRVRWGDTLSHVAVRYGVPGLSLSQKLVAIFRDNPLAFLRENMNLVKAGAVLTMPDAERAQAVDRDEALRIVREHLERFHAVRGKAVDAIVQRHAPVQAFLAQLIQAHERA
jgi:FimV-like protein